MNQYQNPSRHINKSHFIPSTFSKVQKMNSFAQPQKNQDLTIFVGGLSSKCQSAPLRSYFIQFGSITSCEPQTWKKNSAKCRGFAILKCGDRDTYERILNQEKHLYNGRNIDCKKYFSSKDKLESYNKSLKQRKVLVTGFNEDLTTVDLEKYFSRYGELDIAYAVKSCKTGKSKGYGYICFKDKKSRDTVLEIKYFNIRGDKVSCVHFQQKQVKEMEKMLSQNKVENVQELLKKEVDELAISKVDGEEELREEKKILELEINKLKEEQGKKTLQIEELPTKENTPVMKPEKKKESRKFKLPLNIKKFVRNINKPKDTEGKLISLAKDNQEPSQIPNNPIEPNWEEKQANKQQEAIQISSKRSNEVKNSLKSTENVVAKRSKKRRSREYSLFGGFKSRNLFRKFKSTKIENAF